MQSYNSAHTFVQTETKILSWHIFKAERNTTIKAYLLELLSASDVGMTCREISKHSDIEVQSLTNPLKTLVDEGKLEVIGIKRSLTTNRLVQIYGMPLETCEIELPTPLPTLKS